MPELPEVEIVRRGLSQVSLNKPIVGGEVLLRRTVAHPSSISEFLSGLKGCAIAHWDRRGKYLLGKLVNSEGSGGWLGVHLRMTGQLLWFTSIRSETVVSKHTRVRLFLAGDCELRFVDTRTFGRMWWVPATVPVEEAIAALQRLGPEPFSPQFSTDYLQQRLHVQKRPIKNALLDQALVAGIGNIYADEALFLSGIHPATPAASLTLPQVQRLHHTLLDVLSTSVDAGGTTFRDFINVQGINGNYGGMAWVYQRHYQPCRTCGTPIQRLKLAGRSAHFCPQCQPNQQMGKLST